MGVLNPVLLWGMLGISVPVIIHLLNRFRHREIEWGAMALLRKALVVRSRQVRIEDLIVLLLRCLAILLIALAMARLTLKASGSRWLRKDPEVAVVIAIDASYSMAHRPLVHSRFGRAADRVRDVLKTIKPGTPVSLVLMGARPRMPIRNEGYEKERFDHVLHSAAPVPERLNLELCLEKIKALVGEIKAPTRECYIVTDAQRSSWEHLSDEAKQHLEDLGRDARLFVLPVPSASAENVAVTQFSLVGRTLRSDTMARYTAEVENFGSAAVAQVNVGLYVDGKAVDRRDIKGLQAGERRPVQLLARFRRPGTAQLFVKISHDALDEDNVRYAVAEIGEGLRVLCVEGGRAIGPSRGRINFVATALLPKQGPESGPKLNVETVADLGDRRKGLSDYEVIVLANVGHVRPTQAAALRAYVERGGGLILFLGSEVKTASFNRDMADEKAPLSPVTLKEDGDNPARSDKGWGLAAPALDHPLARPLLNLQTFLQHCRIQRFFRADPTSDAQVVLTLDDEGTSPFLLEKRLGLGKVLLFTSSADRAWGDFPLAPPYPILLHQAVIYLTRKAHERHYRVGDPLVIPVSAPQPRQEVVFRDPQKQETRIRVGGGNGQRVARYEDADSAGFFEIDEVKEGVTSTRAAAVNVDTNESDVKTVREGDLAKGLEGLPAQLIPAGQDTLSEIQKSRRGHELWRILLLLGLAVLLVEQVLAHHFSKRMAIRDDLVVEGGPEALLAASEPVEE